MYKQIVVGTDGCDQDAQRADSRAIYQSVSRALSCARPSVGASHDVHLVVDLLEDG